MNLITLITPPGIGLADGRLVLCAQAEALNGDNRDDLGHREVD